MNSCHVSSQCERSAQRPFARRHLGAVGARRGRGGNSTGWSPKRMKPRLWLRPDLAGSSVSSWNDASGNGHLFPQSTPANRPTLATNAALNNQPVFRFNGTDQWFDCSSALGTWKFCHDGSGVDIYIVAQYTGTDSGALIATCASNAPSTSAGMMVFGYSDAAGADFWFGVQNGSSAARPIDSTSTGSLVTNAAGHVFRAYLTDSATPKWGHDVDEVLAGSGNAYGGTGLTNANEAGQMRIGGELSGSTARMAAMDIAEILIFDRRLSASEDAQLRAYFDARYQGSSVVSAPPTIASATLRAGWIMSAGSYVAESAGKVTTWSSFAGTLHPRSLVQANGSQQPQRRRPGGFKSKYTLFFDGTNNQELVDSGAAADWTFMHDGTGVTIFEIWRSNVNTATAHQLLATSALASGTSRGVNWSFAASTGALDFRVSNGTGYVLSSTGPTSAIATTIAQWSAARYASGADPDYTGNYSGGSGTASEAAAPSGSAPASGLTVGGVSGSTAQQLNGDLCAVLVFAGEATDQDIAALAAWANSEFGVAA